jgi:hypothetical protein
VRFGEGGIRFAELSRCGVDDTGEPVGLRGVVVVVHATGP